MRRPGLIARQSAAKLKAQQYNVGEGVRAVRGVALQLYDLRRRKNEADQRVETARERLEKVDVFGLRRELEDAIKSQAEIETKLVELQGENVLMTG